MSRRGKIRLISFGVALIIILMAAVAACHVGAGGYTTRLDAQSTRAFGEAHSAVSRLQRSLDACAYATDAPMQSALCTQLYADAQAAETALSLLPVELDALEDLSRQIAVTGDYACLLSRTAADGNTLTHEALSVLSVLSEPLQCLNDQLSEIQDAFSQGDLITESRLRLTDSLNNLEDATDVSEQTLDDAFHELSASFPVSEPLVYDGKFSDHSGESSYLLSGRPIILPEEARQQAASFLNCDPLSLQPLDFKGGDFPCWRFWLPEQNAVIAISVRGGEVVQYLSDCPKVGEADPNLAETVAQSFLSEHGYPEMESVETISGGSEVTMTFVPVIDDVLCLPDCVSMRICPATGKVTAFDASEYLKHHAKRSFPETESGWSPPENLSVQSRKKVVVLSPGGQDRFCVEYLCHSDNGETVCVDVNAVTGLQERIRIGDVPLRIAD